MNILTVREQAQVLALYLHNDWKITPKFTLNIGIRLERHGGLTERFNRSVKAFDAGASSPIEAEVRANYIQDPIPEIPVSEFAVNGGLTFPGVNGNPRQLWRTNNNWLPRIGFAYQIAPKTVARGGYGVYFETLGVMYVRSNLTGFNRTTDLVASVDNGQSYVASLANPFPNGFLRPLGAEGGLSTNLGQGVSFFRDDLKNPYMQRWQLSIQQQLLGASMIEISYVGNRGTRARVTRDLNNYRLKPVGWFTTESRLAAEAA